MLSVVSAVAKSVRAAGLDSHTRVCVHSVHVRDVFGVRLDMSLSIIV